MPFIESILRPCAVAALALSTVLGTFSLNARAETSVLTPSDIIAREVELAVQHVHEVELAMQLATQYVPGLNYEEALNRYEKALSGSIKMNGKQHREVARLMNDIGVIYLKMGKYTEARDILMQAIGIAGKNPDDPYTATIYLNLGATSYLLGDYEKAVSWHQKRAVAVPGVERPDQIGMYKDIASVHKGPGGSAEWCAEALMDQKHKEGVEYLNKGEHAKAREILTQAAKIGEKVPLSNINSSKVEMLYGNIGAVFYRLGDYEKALNWYQKALVIRENFPDTIDLVTPEIYAGIASIHERQGNYQIALDWYVKAQAAHDKALGVDHPSVAALYDRIAAMHQYLDRQNEAQEWRQRATAVRDKAMNEEDAGTVSALRDAALIYVGQGDFENALESYKQVLAAGEKSLGVQHPINTATRNDIAGVYDKKGDYKQAVIWYKKVLAEQEKAQNKDRSAIAVTHSNIAVAESRSGNNKKALENLQRAIAIFEGTAGESHPGIPTAYTNVAWVYSRMNNYDKAEEWARKAMLVNEKTFGKTHPATGMSYGNIAMTYMNRKQYDKAISGYLEAYRIYFARFGDAHPQTQSFRGTLEKVYKLENARKKIENPKPFDKWLSESMGG